MRFRKMTDREEGILNKLIAAGGWIRRAKDKWRVLAWTQTEHALTQAESAINGAIDLLREPDGRDDKKF